MGSQYSQLSLSERHQIARWRDAKVPVLDMAVDSIMSTRRAPDIFGYPFAGRQL